MSIREAVAKVIAIEDPHIKRDVDGFVGIQGMHRAMAKASISTFLRLAAEQGWHLRPDEATADMCRATDGHFARPSQWRAMLAVAPKFEWDK